MRPTEHDCVERALCALRRGSLVLVVDDRTREDEGDFVVGAEHATPESVNTMITMGRGLLCAATHPDIVERLELPLMVAANSDTHRTAFTVSVDAVGTGTGISAADRSWTLRALADLESRAADLRRPGHVFPLRAVRGGVLERRGHTEAAVDLLTIAGLVPVAGICEVLDDQGRPARRPFLVALAEELDIPVLDVADVVRHRLRMERSPRCAGARLPTRHGVFTALAHVDDKGAEHLALTLGDYVRTDPTLVRVHSECLIGDVLGSLRCDCRDQLDTALKAIADEGAGVLIYLRGQEGREIDLANKLRAYALQDLGRATVDADLGLGLPVDSRAYAPAAALLEQLGVSRVNLMTNNPSKANSLVEQGIDVVAQIPIGTTAYTANRRHFATTRTRPGPHRTPHVDGTSVLPTRPRVAALAKGRLAPEESRERRAPGLTRWGRS